MVTGHFDSFYEGDYWKAEDWNGFPHYAKGDRSAHLFYYEFGGDGYWQIDWREQDGTEDLYDGGYALAEPHIEDIIGNGTQWGSYDVDTYEEGTHYVNFALEYREPDEAPACWGGDAHEHTECMESGGDEYAYDDEGRPTGDGGRGGGRRPEGDWDWYYYGDDWSIAVKGDDTESAMAASFQDFFYWAIVGEAGESGDCMATCGEMETMCCAGVSLRQGDTYMFEAHCMNQQVVEENYVTQLGDMDVELVCQDTGPRGDGAKFLAVGASILSLLAMAL